MSTSVFLEEEGTTYIFERDGFYVDIGIANDLTVTAYIKTPDGERVIERTNIEDIDRDLWSAIRGMLAETPSTPDTLGETKP